MALNRIEWGKRAVRRVIGLWGRRDHGGKACREKGSMGGGQVSHGGSGEGASGQGSHECQVGHGGPGLCGECRELLEYSLARLEHCKFGNTKTKCHKCPVHCYRPDMREKIRTVMRFSGPRMLLYHPLEALRYLFSR